MISEYFPAEAVYKTQHLLADRAAELAAKENITMEEFKRRCEEVIKATRNCTLYLGEVLYPSKHADFVKYGTVRLVTKCASYYTYGDLEWNDPPFILSVAPTNKPDHIINCTDGWVQRTPHPHTK